MRAWRYLSIVFSGSSPVRMCMAVVKCRYARKIVVMSSTGKWDRRAGPSAEAVNMPVIIGGDAFIVMQMSSPCSLIGRGGSASDFMAMTVVYTCQCGIRVDMTRDIAKADKVDGMAVRGLLVFSAQMEAPCLSDGFYTSDAESAVSEPGIHPEDPKSSTKNPKKHGQELTDFTYTLIYTGRDSGQR